MNESCRGCLVYQEWQARMQVLAATQNRLIANQPQFVPGEAVPAAPSPVAFMTSEGPALLPSPADGGIDILGEAARSEFMMNQAVRRCHGIGTSALGWAALIASNLGRGLATSIDPMAAVLTSPASMESMKSRFPGCSSRAAKNALAIMPVLMPPSNAA